MSLELTEKDRLRNAILPMLNRVPASINSAGVKQVRDWKELIVKARKATASSKTSAAALTSIYTQLSGFQ